MNPIHTLAIAAITLPLYFASQEVRAAKIASVESESTEGKVGISLILPDHEEPVRTEVTVEWVAEEDPEAGGYLVVGPDGSMVYAEAGDFENEFKPAPLQVNEANGALQPHQQRVVAEAAELREKLGKLETFSQGDVFKELPQDEQNDLTAQQLVMGDYLKILDRRITRFVSGK